MVSGCSSAVEHHVANVRVEGSIPFARSIRSAEKHKKVAFRPLNSSRASCRRSRGHPLQQFLRQRPHRLSDMPRILGEVGSVLGPEPRRVLQRLRPRNDTRETIVFWVLTEPLKILGLCRRGRVEHVDDDAEIFSKPHLWVEGFKAAEHIRARRLRRNRPLSARYGNRTREASFPSARTAPAGSRSAPRRTRCALRAATGQWQL